MAFSPGKARSVRRPWPWRLGRPGRKGLELFGPRVRDASFFWHTRVHAYVRYHGLPRAEGLPRPGLHIDHGPSLPCTACSRRARSQDMFRREPETLEMFLPFLGIELTCSLSVPVAGARASVGSHEKIEVDVFMRAGRRVPNADGTGRAAFGSDGRFWWSDRRRLPAAAKTAKGYRVQSAIGRPLRSTNRWKDASNHEDGGGGRRRRRLRSCRCPWAEERFSLAVEEPQDVVPLDSKVDPCHRLVWWCGVCCCDRGCDQPPGRLRERQLDKRCGVFGAGKCRQAGKNERGS
ncbi:uncharacterized protein BDZ83DRAFT_404591 [Colletotrichum acutatum]|uniref:Uncharacterized protein n=1 Tax=Glomerella acutata TaxID=27357 RepID=A0AAD8XN79_GLOAC|nr:uncharacterized protein BDZ83DRAFT_404591 [Colletotrichum acutatum]KAK1730416.1 hypothetical protein BDZ83DRAFT_404591 [Colletotrichum acutatum]